MNPTRTGLITTLVDMGADREIENGAGSRAARRSPTSGAVFIALKAARIRAERAPSMIDEYPVLAVAAAARAGTTMMGVWKNCGSRKATAWRHRRRSRGQRRHALETGEDWLVVHGLGGRCPAAAPSPPSSTTASP